MSHRITIFLPSFEGGGAERVMIQVANSLASRDVAVDCVVANGSGIYRNEVHDKITIYDLKQPRVFKSIIPLARYFRKRRPTCCLSTIMHCNVACIAAKILSLTSVNIVVRESCLVELSNGKPLENGLSLIPKIAGWLYPYANSVICVSSGMKRQLLEVLDLPDNHNVDVINNPIDRKALEALSREQHETLFDEKKRVLRLISVGRLSPEKNYSMLFVAISNLTDILEVELVILGEGKYRTKLQVELENLGLTDKVKMPGFYENPFPHICDADIFILSSKSEGMPNSLIQAMFLGKKSICTEMPYGPIPDLMDTGMPCSVSSDNPEALAEKIYDLSKSEDWNGPSTSWLEKFSIESVVDRYGHHIFDSKSSK